LIISFERCALNLRLIFKFIKIWLHRREKICGCKENNQKLTTQKKSQATGIILKFDSLHQIFFSTRK
jgi:hypothetical protein